MKLMIMYPLAGETITEEKNSNLTSHSEVMKGSGKNKIEVHNSEGNLVGIVSKKSLLKMLNLEQGFYYVREKDRNNRIINSGMMLL
jgi:predicted transcriptional regulator